MKKLSAKKFRFMCVAVCLLTVLFVCCVTGGKRVKVSAAQESADENSVTDAAFLEKNIEKIRKIAEQLSVDRENLETDIITRLTPADIRDFFYFSSGDDYDFKTDFCYSDEYFFKTSSEYNGSLATMSLCFAMSAFSSNTARTVDTRSRNAAALLTKAGFTNIETNEDFKKEPETDSVGVIAGQKYIYDNGHVYSLLAVAVCGAGYRTEWAGNLNIGESGRHRGFAVASEKAAKFIQEYIETYADVFRGDIKIWMTGFSRGAAITNLMAADITRDGRIGESEIEKENVFAYCFETPCGENTDNISCEEAAAYTNIHNICNPADAVPRVAFKEWGFIRYGTDENIIPLFSDEPEKAAEMTERYKNIKTTETMKTVSTDEDGAASHILESFCACGPGVRFSLDEGLSFYTVKDEDKTMAEFLDEIVSSTAAGFESRAVYAEEIEPQLTVMIADFMNGKYGECDWGTVPELLTSKLEINSKNLYKTIIKGLKDGVEGFLTDCIIESVCEAGLELPENEAVYDMTKKTIKSVISAGMKTIFKGEFNNILTLVNNVALPVYAHYPELCLAWLESFDENYAVTESE